MNRLNALQVRERLFLFFTVLLCCGALVDTLWLSPAQTVHQQLRVRVDKQAAELQRLRDALRALPKPDELNRETREALQQTKMQLDQVNQDVAQLLAGDAGRAPLHQALVHLLRRHAGLKLVRTVALAPEVAGPGNNNGTDSLPSGLTRQGVALTVAGSYADLTRYVLALEQAMPFVRWGTMTLGAEQGEPELTLQLFLIGELAP